MITISTRFEKIDFYNSCTHFSVRSMRNYTVPAAVSELEKIILVKNSKDIYIRRYGLTKRQRKILGQFGVTESYLNKVADKVNTLV